MNVLIIGLGSIAKKHIAALQKIDSGVVIYALRNSKAAQEVEGVKSVFEIGEIDMQTIDFVIISNPTAKHYATIEEIHRYGTPLFIEKPLFSEISKSTEDLVAKVSQSKQITYVACNLRFLESLQRLKTELKGKRINEVNIYCGSYLPDWRPGIDFRTVYSANKDQGGGVHIDLIHESDYAYWIFGKPLKARSFFANKSSLEITAYDYANYLWEYDDFCVSVILNYYRKDSKRTVEVLTDEGTYKVDLLKNVIYHNNIDIFVSEKRMIDTYYDQMRFFINEILQKKQTFNTIEEANSVLSLCLENSN